MEKNIQKKRTHTRTHTHTHTHIYKTESLCCDSAEIDTTLQTNYTSIKKDSPSLHTILSFKTPLKQSSRKLL